jgi:hypothetical protein
MQKPDNKGLNVIKKVSLPALINETNEELSQSEYKHGDKKWV